MIKILAVLFLAFLPGCVALNCYVCASGMAGCNDPFDATASNVTTYSLSTNIFCVKTMATASVVSRYGSSSCTSVPFIAGSLGMACCQSDLCNRAQGIYQMPLLAIGSSLLILFKIY